VKEKRAPKPLRGRQLKVAEIVAAHPELPNTEVARQAGYTSKRALEQGVTVAEAKRDVRVQKIIATSQADFRRAVGAALQILLATLLPRDFTVPLGAKGRKRESPYTLKEAAQQALSAPILKAAGLAKDEIEHSGPGGSPIEARVSFYMPENGRRK
jgi:hypothetical protein